MKGEWHINDEGEVKRCNATIQCEFDKNGKHSKNKTEVLAYAEEFNRLNNLDKEFNEVSKSSEDYDKADTIQFPENVDGELSDSAELELSTDESSNNDKESFDYLTGQALDNMRAAAEEFKEMQLQHEAAIANLSLEAAKPDPWAEVRIQKKRLSNILRQNRIEGGTPLWVDGAAIVTAPALAYQLSLTTPFVAAVTASLALGVGIHKVFGKIFQMLQRRKNRRTWKNLLNNDLAITNLPPNCRKIGNGELAQRGYFEPYASAAYVTTGNNLVVFRGDFSNISRTEITDFLWRANETFRASQYNLKHPIAIVIEPDELNRQRWKGGDTAGYFESTRGGLLHDEVQTIHISFDNAFGDNLTKAKTWGGDFSNRRELPFVDHLLAHEVGHAVEFQHSFFRSWEKYLNPFFSRWFKQHKEQLSDYGKKNANEGYAEAYAQWLLCGNDPDTKALTDAYAKKYRWKRAELVL